MRSFCPATPEADDTGTNKPPLSGGLLRCSCMMPIMARAGARGVLPGVSLSMMETTLQTMRLPP